MARRHHLFRERGEHHHTPVTYIELFFDLVFVFAITQLSHRLLKHLSLHGALETLILFLAIWWVWIYTSWTTNWLDPDRGHVRLMILSLMLGGLALSSAVPDAFGRTGLLFAGAYCAMQTGRTLYMVWAYSGGHSPGGFRNFQRITFYFLLSAPLWLWGAFQEGEMRLVGWAGALAIEYAGPFLWFRTPFIGRSTGADWDISGGHMAERCALFMIIAFGEAVLVTGATFATLPHDRPTILAFVTSFVGSAAMWWIYFDTGAKRATDLIEGAGVRAGQIARNAYTYLHMPIVAAVVVTAVGDEKMLAHPVGHVDLSFVLTAVGGPMLFLLGNQMFKWMTSDLCFPPFSHFIGLALLLGVGAGGILLHWQPLAIGMLATLSLILTALWEWFSWHGGWRRWAPWLERLGWGRQGEK